MRKYLFQTLIVLFVATVWVGCEDDNDVTNTYTISGTANGAQEVPAVSTQGTGTVSGTYDKQTKMLDYTITWNNVTDTPTMMHFHGPADPGANAGVMIPITDFTQAASGSKSGMATLTSAQDSALLSNKMYYNLHTPLHPGGEIRAQLTATAD